jgi:putative hydrolase of the HAD superfamily
VIRAVIFDMGKVLVWFDNSIFFRKLAALSGVPADRVREAAHLNLELVQAFDRGDIPPAEFKDRVCSALSLSLSYEEFYEMFNDVFSLNEETTALLPGLRAAGLRLVLLSNTDPERFAFLRRRFPETQVFDDFVLSYEVRLLKPDPAIYREAVRRAGAAPGECVFIDDLPANTEGARREGIPSLLYEWGKTRLDAELRRLGVDW